MLGSKSGFVRGFCSEALTQHEMSIELAVPPSSHFLLFRSNITRWLQLLWFWTHFSVGKKIPSCYTNTAQFQKSSFFILRMASFNLSVKDAVIASCSVIQKNRRNCSASLVRWKKERGALADLSGWAAINYFVTYKWSDKAQTNFLTNM